MASGQVGHCLQQGSFECQIFLVLWKYRSLLAVEEAMKDLISVLDCWLILMIPLQFVSFETLEVVVEVEVGDS